MNQKRNFLTAFLLLAVLQLFAFTSASAKSKHTFEIKGGNFVYDGKPIQIHSGEMHFSRVPAPYWHHRLKMMKAMGLNAVATYVFWNFHETAQASRIGLPIIIIFAVSSRLLPKRA